LAQSFIELFPSIQFTPLSGVKGEVGDDSLCIAKGPEFCAVKSGIRLQKQALNRGVYVKVFNQFDEAWAWLKRE